MTICIRRRGYYPLSLYMNRLCSIRHNSILSHRASERLPTNLYHKLTQYGQSEVKLVPKIEHTALYSRVINKDKPFSLNGNPTFKPSQHRLYQLLEANVFHIMCVIECLKQGKDIPQLHNAFFRQIMVRLSKTQEPVVCEKLESKLRIPHSAVLQMGLECFSSITAHIKEPYTEDDLITWIESISAKSVSSSMSLITENTPGFVLFDILLRSPTFKESFLVQYELWTHNIKFLMTQMRKDPYIVKSMLDNMTYYGVMYEPHCLVHLYQTTLDFLISPNTRQQVKLNSKFFDGLIWDLAVYSLRYQKLDPIGIANAQELLMSHVRNSEGGSLSLKGYLGIAIVMSRISYNKGVEIFQVAEKKFAIETSSKKDLLSYYLTKIHLAKTSAEAVNTFKIASNQFDYSSTLWLFFIRKLKYLNVMDEKRAKLFYKQMSSSKVKLTNDIVYELLHFICDFTVLKEMLCSVSNGKQGVLNSAFRARYIQLLQLHEFKKGDFPQLPWDKPELEERNSHNYDSVEDCITYIYTTSPVKPIQLIVTYLRFVSKSDSAKFFKLYQEEILHKDHLPNAACLELLLDTAKGSGDAKVSDNLLAPQLAIREFQRNVKATTKSFGISPRDGLWQSYISLLAEFDYVSELSKIMKWWLDLNFRPKKATILLLLNTLPEEFALRHIKHHQVAKSKKDWDWPTTREFKRSKWLQSKSIVNR
ncbi:hypothetical protein CANMA_001876 [Candida margitis]|uniref:uncharacterized protein n=1 Tax=Candida margitis TaxID=1775924 RepID=UPI002226756E|nr:uncharacterized protein CANMA_001876 [Candida margitis]KAI5969072.1 hypothetical protein CANMA_001876 [Candida margitis]